MTHGFPYLIDFVLVRDPHRQGTLTEYRVYSPWAYKFYVSCFMYFFSSTLKRSTFTLIFKKKCHKIQVHYNFKKSPLLLMYVFQSRNFRDTCSSIYHLKTKVSCCIILRLVRYSHHIEIYRNKIFVDHIHDLLGDSI